MMRIFASAFLLITVSLPAVAQVLPPVEVTEPPTRKPGETGDKPAKSEVIIGGQAPSAAGAPNAERCHDAQGAASRSLGCLNQSLRRDVDKVNPSLNAPPLDARSGDTKLGIANLPAVQQQYGQNYGRSVVPFRPAMPTAGSTVIRR